MQLRWEKEKKSSTFKYLANSCSSSGKVWTIRSSRAWKVPSFSHLLVGYLLAEEKKKKTLKARVCVTAFLSERGGDKHQASTGPSAQPGGGEEAAEGIYMSTGRMTLRRGCKV